MPKTNAEKCREYRQKKKENKVKKVPKSSTERVRLFRAHRKALFNEQHNIYIAKNNTAAVHNSENDHVCNMPICNAEKCKNYPNRKKDANGIKSVKKTNAEKYQMYRLRKTILTQGYQSPTNRVLHTTSTSNSPLTFGSSALLVTADKPFRTNATENWQALASPMIIVENGCVKSPARWNEDEDRKESVEALYLPQPSLFTTKLSPHSSGSPGNTPLTSPLSFEASDADVKDENIVNDISSPPDWVLQIEERRLAVEERTARAFEAIATGLAGIQATLEAMRQDAR